MHSQKERANLFKALHLSDNPLILPNVWDSLTAAMVAEAGFPAVATASAAVALSRGFDDGEQIPFEDLVELVGRITADTARNAADPPAGTSLQPTSPNGADRLPDSGSTAS